MTKEDLEKEAEEKAGIYFDSLEVDQGNVSDTRFSDYDIFVAYEKGALDFAKPREKRIADLERKLEQTEKDLTDYQFNYPKIKDLEKENGKLLQRIIQLEKDVTENESDCSMCNFPKLKQDLEKEKCELLGIIQGKDTAIQELEKKNTKLQQACHKWFMRWREAKKDALYYDSSLQKQIQAALKLQKENAELEEAKEQLKKGRTK